MVQIVKKKNFKLIKKLIIKKNEDNFERFTLSIGKYGRQFLLAKFYPRQFYRFSTKITEIVFFRVKNRTYLYFQWQNLFRDDFFTN